MPRFVLLLALLLTLAASTLSAAVIRGAIVENRTGKPLSRVAVVLQPIAGTPGVQAAVRTNNFGGFEFQGLAGGAYVLKASRRGFLPLEYGQKLWNSAGQPIILAADGSSFLNIRLMRYGGITGTIQDENDNGMMGHDVVAYRNTQPPQVAARAKSDDRGMYRIEGLEPGVYLVRTAGNQDEGISYVPTFSKETQLLEGARIVQVLLDEDATGMDIRPAAGKLFTISATVAPCPLEPGAPMTVTLASDMGRRTMGVTCAVTAVVQFGSLPPGAYELYVEMPAIPDVVNFRGAYTQVSVKGDLPVTMVLDDVRPTLFDYGRLPGAPDPQTTVAAGKNSSIAAPPIEPLTARRKDLAGVGPAAPLKLTNNRAMLGPGRWEVSLAPPPGYYVSAFYGPNYGRSVRSRPDGWNEFQAPGGSVRFTVTGGPGEMHGAVKSYSDAVEGAPVYLEAYDPDSRKRLTDLRVTRTDIYGMYRFQGLAPGIYRVLSTFEYQMPEPESMELAGARQVRVEARSDLQMDLDLYGIR